MRTGGWHWYGHVDGKDENDLVKHLNQFEVEDKVPVARPNNTYRWGPEKGKQKTKDDRQFAHNSAALHDKLPLGDIVNVEPAFQNWLYQLQPLLLVRSMLTLTLFHRRVATLILQTTDLWIWLLPFQSFWVYHQQEEDTQTSISSLCYLIDNMDPVKDSPLTIFWPSEFLWYFRSFGETFALP